MGDDQDRDAAAVQGLEQGQDGLAGGLVEVAGGLVGEHDVRLAGQGARDGHPLPLPSGQLGGPGTGPACEADQVEGVQRPAAPFGQPDPGVQEAVGHVVEHGLVLGQEELLEDEPDAGGPQVGDLAVVQRGHVDAGDPHHSRGGPVERAHQVQQRGLARARRAGDGRELALADGEAHAPQGGHRRLAMVDFGHGVHLEHRGNGSLGGGQARRRLGACRGCKGLVAGCHILGTTTLCPAASPVPLTCTSPSASSNSPSDTGTMRRLPPLPATSTA